jgi:VanZ family protein
LRAIAVYSLAFGIVLGFVNTFVLWRAFANVFGELIRDALPWILVSVIVVAGSGFFLRKRNTIRISWPFLIIAVLSAIIGLSITDPTFPAKRIHVPQYFLLTIVVWFALPERLRTSATPVFVLVAAALFGVHDEFLQGLHPSRTFGLRDMVVNICGAMSGICTMLAFTRERADRAEMVTLSSNAVIGVVACLFGVILFVQAATGYRHDLIPYWAVLPVLAGAFWLALAAERLPLAGDRQSLRGIVAICCVFFFYPVLTNVAYLDFV